MQSMQARLDPNYSEPVRVISSEGDVQPLEADDLV
jgi:hypothetical protein